MVKKRRERPRRRARRAEPEAVEPAVEPPASAEEWRESVDYFMRMIPLESKTARRQVRRLMVALDREALEILRIARRLEDPDLTPKDYDWLRRRYGRSEIVTQLGRTFAGEHLALAGLAELSDKIGYLSRYWHEQGGMILDRVESLRVGVVLYEHEIKRLTRAEQRGPGRGRSIAWDYLVREQARWDISDDDVRESHLRVNFVADNAENRLLLLDRIKKHRLRRGVRKKAPKAPGPPRRSGTRRPSPRGRSRPR